MIGLTTPSTQPSSVMMVNSVNSDAPSVPNSSGKSSPNRFIAITAKT